MSDFTIRTTTTPPATVKVQLDPSQSVAEAVAAADAARADAVQTAADRAQTSADADATAADRVQTSADASATAADRVQTGEDVVEAAAVLASSLKIDQNLADLDSAATARTNLGVPPSTRAISTGTGLTGGGDLSADRTISASIASQAQAEAGTATTVLMTPQRTEQHMVANALGWGQTWQNVAGSRAASTSYQNTTGRPICVIITGNSVSTVRAQVSVDNSTWVSVGTIGLTGTVSGPCTFIVPNGHYYRTNGAVTIVEWAELR